MKQRRLSSPRAFHNTERVTKPTFTRLLRPSAAKQPRHSTARATPAARHPAAGRAPPCRGRRRGRCPDASERGAGRRRAERRLLRAWPAVHTAQILPQPTKRLPTQHEDDLVRQLPSVLTPPRGGQRRAARPVIEAEVALILREPRMLCQGCGGDAGARRGEMLVSHTEGHELDALGVSGRLGVAGEHGGQTTVQFHESLALADPSGRGRTPAGRFTAQFVTARNTARASAKRPCARKT